MGEGERVNVEEGVREKGRGRAEEGREGDFPSRPLPTDSGCC